MAKDKKIAVEYIKSLGKERSSANFDLLLELYKEDHGIEVRREIVSSIGRQHDIERIRQFLEDHAFNSHYMDEVYQMFRTVLYKGFDDLKEKMLFPLM